MPISLDAALRQVAIMMIQKAQQRDLQLLERVEQAKHERALLEHWWSLS